jgi:hypothetical protein
MIKSENNNKISVPKITDMILIITKEKILNHFKPLWLDTMKKINDKK